jgi:hypothetical protein
LATKDFDKLWNKCLKGVFGCTNNELSKSACNVQQVKKSAAQYLSKYMSKGIPEGLQSSAPMAEGGYCLPTCWYNLTATMRKAIKKSERYGAEVAEVLEMMRAAEKHPGIVYSKVQQVLDAGGRVVASFVVGWLSEVGREFVGLVPWSG